MTLKETQLSRHKLEIVITEYFASRETTFHSDIISVILGSEK